MSRCFIRKPSFMKIIGAYRSQWKRYLLRIFTFGLYGKKGMGWLKNPKKAFYNWWYYRTSVSIPRLLGYKPSRFSFVFAAILFCVVSVLASPLDVANAGVAAKKIKANRKARFESKPKNKTYQSREEKTASAPNSPSVSTARGGFEKRMTTIPQNKQSEKTEPKIKSVEKNDKSTTEKTAEKSIKAQEAQKQITEEKATARYVIPLKRYQTGRVENGEETVVCEPEKPIDRLDAIKKKHYEFCEQKIKTIIDGGVTTTPQISAMYERLIPFLSEEAFGLLYDKLDEYVTAFNEPLASEYRKKREK